MNWRIVTGIWYAGSILLTLFLLHGASFRDALTTGIISASSVVSVGVLVLYFVLAVAIWDSGNVITRKIKLIVEAILPISIILGIRWAIYTLTHHTISHMRQPAVLSSG
ncbi:MAG: hypothetical protein LUO82_04895 [Methanomicrobiales archaeon]|nr:hypothetical protein [Methanomicrobiales archaeon]